MPNKATPKTAYQAAKAAGKTHLTYAQWQHVRTPEFKAWFGDWENDPQHASQVVHPDTEKQGIGWLGRGFYFAGDKKLAKTFGRKVLSSFLNVRRPFVVQGDSAYGEAKKAYASDRDLENDIAPVLKENGHDGVFINHWEQGEIFTAFNPNQIKSAEHNIGTFSPDNPDIRFSFSAPQRSVPMSNDYAPPTYDEIRTALSYIPTPSSYAAWYPMAFAIKDALGENGKDLWHDWSKQGDNYDARVADATWKSARPKAGGITVATLFKQARDNGYRPDKPAVVLTPEQSEQRALETATKNQIFAASDQVHHQAAAKLAHTIWRNSTEPTAADLAHPYLQNKGIQDLTAVAGIRINRYQGQNKLVIPVYSRNEQTGKTELVNVQQIDEQGEKRFLYGGQKNGGYAILNGTHADMAQGFYIAEGYATAASVHWATGKPVVIAFDAGNLPVVAARIAERDNLPPETPIYLAADNDRVSQTGLEKATEAAAWLGERAQIRLPEFDANDIATWQQKHGQLDKDGKEQFPSDFNDLMELRGLNAIQTAIHAPLSAERIAQVATMQPEINNHIANFKKYNIQPNRPFQFKTLPLDEAGLRFRAQYVLEKFGNEKHRHALIAELAKRGIDIRAQVAELSGQSYRQPEKPLQSPLPNPSQSQNSTQTEKENPMAQQPTPNEIQRHAQNVAQMADAAEREAVMREMAERGIHVRSEVNKILAERAAEMPQQPENEQSATSHTFADELSALNLPSDFSFEYQVLQPNGREIARVHLAGYSGELMVDKIEAEKGGGYVAKSDNILDGMAIHSDNLPNLMREMTFQMRQAAERGQHQEPTTTQPDRQPEKEPPQPTAANHAAVAVSEPPETQAVGQPETPPPHYSEQILTQLAHQYGWTIDDTQTASKIYANANPADGALNPNGNLTLHARFDESHRYLALESGWDTVFDIDARNVPPPVAAQVLNQFAEQAAFNTPFERGDVETTIRQETGKYYLSQGLQQQGYEPSANNTMWAKTLGDDTIHIALSPNEVTVSYTSPHTEPQLQKFSIQDVDGMMERVQQYEQQAQSHFRQPENQQGELLQSSNQQENTMLAPENRLVFTTREAAVEYEAINRVIQVTMLEEMNRVEPHPDGVTNAVQYLQDLLTQNKAQLAHETDKEQREALQNDIDVGAMAISLMQQGLSSPQLQQRAENLLAEAQRVPAVEVENSIEFGGITQEPSQSPTQPTEAQSQRETISAAEVQENLRRAKEKERIEQAQQFTQEAAVGAAIGMAADVALDAAIPGSSMAKTAASVAAGLAGDAAAERALQQNPTQKTERDAENAEKQPEIKQPQPILDLSYTTPSGLNDRYVRVDGKYMDWNNRKTVIFKDDGSKLKTAKNNAQVISDMLDVAQAKNWGSIKISGSKDFRQAMWLEAERRGIASTGYKPTKFDLANRDQMLGNNLRNSIEAQNQPELKTEPAPSPAAQQPENRQPETLNHNNQDAGSLFDDDVATVIYSEASHVKNLAETPDEMEQAAQVAGKAVETVHDIHATQNVAQKQPARINYELESAKAVFQEKYSKLSENAKARLNWYREQFTEPLLQKFKESNQHQFHDLHLLQYYENTAKMMHDKNIDLPAVIVDAMPEQLRTFEQAHKANPNLAQAAEPSLEQNRGRKM